MPLDSLRNFLVFALDRPWLAWGIIPVACAALSYCATSLCMEWVIRRNWCAKYLITYLSDAKAKESASGGRLEHAAAVQLQKDAFSKKPMDLRFQLQTAVLVVAGPAAWVAGVLSSFVTAAVVGHPENVLGPSGEVIERRLVPESGASFLMDFVLLMFVADFLLYLGHRVQHQVPFLWKHFHSLHHQLQTPTPIGTAFIHHADATLQASLPLVLSAMIVGPHPVTYWVYILFHLANNVFNHTGINALWFDIVTLKVLPFRSSNLHHDAHHRYSNYGGNAKNYAEMFWIWDWMFGTLREV